MKIFYKKDQHVILKFGATEMKQALGVLKALAQYFKADFIFKVAQELQDDLFPKPKLPFVQYYRLCTKCFCEIDLRKDKFLHRIGEKDDTWEHQECKPLKDDSVRER